MHHSDFVHLHLHTKYSLLDGANTIEAILDTADRYRMPALAITDHGNMYGVIEFYQKAIKKGIKPIIGCEAYIAPESRLDKKDNHGIPNASFHLLLLAANNVGYKNLIKLVSDAHLEGFYYRPRIDKEILARHSEGLIVLSSCLKGEIPYRIREGRPDEALRAGGEYIDIFGKDNFYFEIQDNRIEDQTKVNKELMGLSKRLGIQVVATGDCHYLKREDARMHEILLCIQTGANINNAQRLRFATDEFYMKSPDEMRRAFAEIPEAILNTREIAKRCNVEIELGRSMLPVCDVPDGYTKESFLEELAFKGLEERLKDKCGMRNAELIPISPPLEKGGSSACIERSEKSPPFLKGDLGGLPQKSEYGSRLKEELRVINSMGYAGYFLIVWDFINYAKANSIPVGPGRGSSAGSLVAYCLKITDLDPLKYGLLFERFLNPERISMPDIDIDFCMDKRDRVIQYVSEKYGSDHVAQIITFGTMAARGVIRDVGRSLDISYAEVDRIAKLVPEGPNVTLEDAINSEPNLKELVNSDARMKELMEYARSLEGLTRHASTHAAGIVISKEPLTEYVPLCRGTNDEVVTQFAMEDIEKIGLVKFDFLGLKTLTVIDHTVRLINQLTPFDIIRIPLDNPATYELLSSGNTAGIFQLESAGMRDILVKIKPDRFEDLIAILALYRPGPIGSGMVDDYVKRRRGAVSIKYETPELKDILKETHGVIVYQEQVMKIANVLAGFSMGEADILRRAMGKKDPETMANLKERFIQGAKVKRINEKRAEKIFDLIEYFAGYGFNKSHSAAYALISYQTAYLKAHYPVEYMAAMLTCEMGKMEKITAGIRECKEMGIEILPPDVNESERDFTVSGRSIRFGLVAIKNVGESAIESIISTRKEGSRFTSLFDFCRRVDLRKVNKRTIESLIKSGAFDTLRARRSQLMEVLDKAMSIGSSCHKTKSQVTIFETLDAAGDGNALETLPVIPEWDEHILLKSEKDTIGFYITGHPLARYELKIRRHTSITTKDLLDLEDGKEVTICGIITNTRVSTTKKGEKMAFVRVEDLEGGVEIIVFPDLYRASAGLLMEEKPVIITGTVNRNDTGLKIKSGSIQDLLTAPEKISISRGVEIRIHSLGLTADDLKTLRGILEGHSGTCPVYLYLITNQKEYVLSLDNGLKIKPSDDFMASVESRFGKNSVIFN